jgi:hypothetical protein
MAHLLERAHLPLEMAFQPVFVAQFPPEHFYPARPVAFFEIAAMLATQITARSYASPAGMIQRIRRTPSGPFRTGSFIHH